MQAKSDRVIRDLASLRQRWFALLFRLAVVPSRNSDMIFRAKYQFTQGDAPCQKTTRTIEARLIGLPLKNNLRLRASSQGAHWKN
jgi:hypothetical protein